MHSHTDAIDSTFRPVFLVGCPRSGTTLLAAILDRHSCYAVPPETHFFTHFLAAYRRQIGRVDQNALIDLVLHDRFLSDLNLERSELQVHLPEAPIAPAQLLRAILTTYCEKQGKQIPAEKTPAHLFSVPQILTWFPDAKVICIVRDGRDVALSMKRERWGYCSLRRYSLIWKRAAIHSLRYERAFTQQFLSVRFEDLVRRPDDVLASVTRFLGTDAEAHLLDTNRKAGVVPEWERSWKAKSLEAIDASRAQAWKSELARDCVWEINSVIGAYLKRLGYEDHGMEGCSGLCRLRHWLTNTCFSIIFTPTLQPYRAKLRSILERNGWWRQSTPKANCV